MRGAALLALVIGACPSEVGTQVAPPVPARREASAPAPSTGGLVVRWVAPQSALGAIIGSSRDRVGVEAGDEVLLYDLDDGAIVARHTPEPGSSALIGETLLSRPILGPIAALDPATGARRWRRAAKLETTIHDLPLAAETTHTFVLGSGELSGVGGPGEPSGLLFLDRKTGAVRGEARLPGVRTLLGDGERLYVAGVHNIWALAEDGSMLWGRGYASGGEDCEVVRQLAISEETLFVISGCRTIEALDRVTGLPRDILDYPHRTITALDALDGILYLALATGDGSPAYVMSYDLAKKQIPWGAALDADARALKVTPEGVLVLGGGVLKALHPVAGVAGSARGAELSLGEVDDLRWTTPKDAPWRLVALTHSGRLVAVEPTPDAPPPRSVRIRGQVSVHREMGPRAEPHSLADIRVRVGDRWWSADAEGRFEIELKASGAIRLSIDPAAVDAESSGAPMGCFSAPLEVFAEEGQTQEVALSIFCPAPC